MAGHFITFEGIEGCGKTTQVGLLESRLIRQHRSVEVVREPGGTAIGDRVREILLDPALTEMTPRAEALLYAAARAQLVDQLIKPALESGKTVLCDRYIDSSLAYQSYARGLDFQTIVSINEWAASELMPDLTFLFRITAELGLGRTVGREVDRMERESLDFHRLVEAGYEDLAVKYAERFVLIDGRDAIEHIHKQVVEAVTMLFGRRSD